MDTFFTIMSPHHALSFTPPMVAASVAYRRLRARAHANGRPRSLTPLTQPNSNCLSRNCRQHYYPCPAFARKHLSSSSSSFTKHFQPNQDDALDDENHSNEHRVTTTRTSDTTGPSNESLSLHHFTPHPGQTHQNATTSTLTPTFLATDSSTDYENNNHNNSHNNNYNNNYNNNNNNNNNDDGIPSNIPYSSLAFSVASSLPNLPVSSDERFRILYLISDTGGGHRASAQALSSAFEQLYPNRIESTIVDFWVDIVGRPFTSFPQSYSFLAKNPPLWRMAWTYGKFPVTRRLTEEFSNLVGHQNFKDTLQSLSPHLIISVHPLTQFIPLRVLRSLHPSQRPPFVTVVTDLGGAHPTWFHRDVDLCFVPTPRVRAIALRCGLAPSQLRLIGLPVRPSFWRDNLTKEIARDHLSLSSSPHHRIILIVGGGDGVGGVDKIATSIASKISTCDSILANNTTIVIICGKNNRLKQRLVAQHWPIPVIVNGFVNNMSDWMTAADLIVSKAGPGTIAESLIRGLPIILSGFLPGQEAPNVSYVTQSGVGAFSRDPGTIAQIVVDWVSSPRGLAARASRAKALGRPDATYNIVREIAALTSLASFRRNSGNDDDDDDDDDEVGEEGSRNKGHRSGSGDQLIADNANS